MYTEQQVEEKVREAVEQTEKSFGGTFKRMKSENEDLQAKLAEVQAEMENTRTEYQERVASLETSLGERDKTVADLAVRGEIDRQLRESGPLPEQFITAGNIEYSDNPDILRENVAGELTRGRNALDEALKDMGIAAPAGQGRPVNPTNPPSRDTSRSRDMKTAESQAVLHDMVQRGLLR